MIITAKVNFDEGNYTLIETFSIWPVSMVTKGHTHTHSLEVFVIFLLLVIKF